MTLPVNLGKLIDRNRPLNKIAVINFDGSHVREVSYDELDALADGVARALVARGYSRGDRIAILSSNNSESLAAYLGIMRAGMVSVPINFRLPRNLVEYIVEDCGARLVFCDTDRRPMVPAGVETINFDDADAFQAFVDRGPFAAVAPRKDDPSTFLYTSGSTGRPKGVILSHDAQLWVVRIRLGSRNIEDQRFLIAAPLYHMNALALSHLVFAGHASMVLMPLFRVKPYVDAISRFHCTWLTSVPPMVAMMFNDKEAMARADLSSVQSLRMGSAPASEVLLDDIKHNIPQARVMNVYGTTEGSPIVFAPHPDGRPTPHLSLGYKHPLVDLRLIDAEGKESNQGVLQLRSPGLMNGYHNRPDIPAPITADGYYTTGDVFRRDADGFYYFIGRADDMFVCGGENIFPGVVERMLETHPDVMDACVVPIDDPIKGKKPVAFVRLAPGAKTTATALKAYALEHGAAYQHPRNIWFLDAFPLASTNKVDRAALMRRAQSLSTVERAPSAAA
ncbi:MAG: long-chain fatty acid--CoA ligase [Candidimonas sp.]|nr:MAG: long-chain fatty acid--CoA ligase [Candidimonas sp.]